MSASADISGMLRGLRQARARGVAVAKRALDVAGEQVIGDAQQLTPVDTGALAGSATTLPAEEKAGSIEKTIGFATDYAAAVHERLDQHHEVGQAKYLETAMRNDAEKVAAYVAERIRKEMS